MWEPTKSFDDLQVLFCEVKRSSSGRLPFRTGPSDNLLNQLHPRPLNGQVFGMFIWQNKDALFDQHEPF